MLAAYAEPIAAAYALGSVLDLTGPVARGEMGEVWQLRTERGRWAVKRSFAELPAAGVERVGEFQTFARGHGVRAPAALTTRDGRYGYPVGGAAVRVAEWVELLEPDPMIEPQLVGRAVAGLHRAAWPTQGRPDPWFTDPIGAPAWDSLIMRAGRQRSPFADRLAGFRDELLALERLLTPMEPVQTCHLDLWADNLRRTPDGGVSILDWDNCGPADPSRELALVLFEYAHTSAGRTADLYRAYCEAGGPGRVRQPSDFSVLIAVLGNIVAVRVQRCLDPATPAVDRARAEGHLDQFFDDPLTRTTIDDLLAVTGELDAGGG